jgi:hypothetical protein
MASTPATRWEALFCCCFLGTTNAQMHAAAHSAPVLPARTTIPGQWKCLSQSSGSCQARRALLVPGLVCKSQHVPDLPFVSLMQSRRSSTGR